MQPKVTGSFSDTLISLLTWLLSSVGVLEDPQGQFEVLGLCLGLGLESLVLGLAS